MAGWTDGWMDEHLVLGVAGFGSRYEIQMQMLGVVVVVVVVVAVVVVVVVVVVSGYVSEE